MPDLDRAVAEWGWLLGALGYAVHQEWDAGCSWRLGATYLVVERSSDLLGPDLGGPDLAGPAHERRRPGLNHLAFHGGARSAVDALVAAAPAHGWRLLFAERHPWAGGPAHYAGYLDNSDGFEVEIVAAPA